MAAAFVEFEISDDHRFTQLDQVVNALGNAKRTDVFRDDSYWLSFFDEDAKSRFWWPSETEKEECLRRWQSTPVESRWSEVSLTDLSWDFGFMIDAFRNGEYELLGCRRISPQLARLEFNPYSWPYGGTGCMRALIEAFGHRVTVESDA
jgi:hypothetical protein